MTSEDLHALGFIAKLRGRSTLATLERIRADNQREAIIMANERQTSADTRTADERNKTNHLRPNRKAMFAGTDSDYRQRNGEVTIVRELVVGTEVDEECAPMYRVRDDKGDFDAFLDELTPIPLVSSSPSALRSNDQ